MHLAQNGESGVLAVLHINEDPDNSLHLAEKEKGFREYYTEKNHQGFTVITMSLSSPDEPTFEKTLSSLMQEKELKGIFVTTSKGTYLIASFLHKHDKKEVKLIGYDMLEENIRYMQMGVINFLINQNPKRQAFLGINHLAGHLILKKEAPSHDLLPLEIISKENLQSYLNSGIH
jgi:LacI family transcriptional regulator